MSSSALRVRTSARLATSFLTLTLLASTAAAQYSSAGFEALNASAAGTVLTGQDTWTMPAGIDWNVFTYTGNTLSIPQNPLGGAKFVAGVPTSNTVFGRAERVVPYAVASSRYTLSADICPRWIGTPPAAPLNNICSISLQPSATARYFIMLATWPTAATGATWDADLIYFTATGTQTQIKLANTAFQGLATNKWYRWQADFDLATNRILELRLTDIAAGTTATQVAGSWYLAGGSAPTQPPPTALRMFAGGDQNNVVAADNLTLSEKSILQAGMSVATVAVSTSPVSGEMYAINHETNTATKLTLSAGLTADRVNCVMMTSSNEGYVGTNPATVAPGKVYKVEISGSTVTETLVATSGVTGPNLSQICLTGGKLYFCTQNATNTAGSGVLHSVPVTGGAATVVADLSTLTGWIATNGGANAIATVNGKVYVGAFDSSTSPTATGVIVEHDPVANTTAVLLNLPQSKTPASATLFYNTGICYMQGYGGKLQLFSIFGDYLVVDTATKTIVSHTSAAAINPATTSPVNTFFNSYDYDPNTGDLICGSRDGRIQRIASNHIAQGCVTGVGSFATPSGNSVNGVSHLPAQAASLDTSYGEGCPGNNGFTLTDVSSGIPYAGNSAFQLGSYSGTGGDAVVCLIAVTPQTPPIDLTVIGMNGCKMWIGAPLVSVAGVLSGTAAGAGSIRIPLPLPAAAVGAVLYRQWAEVQVTKTNLLGIVISNARKMEVK